MPSNSLVTFGKMTELLTKSFDEAQQKDRMVRRAKFFLSSSDIERYGSLRRPIFKHWGHNVLVAAQEYVGNRDGYWCYGTHNLFDLIPDTTDPLKWPEYQRTPTGWERVPEHEMLEARKPSIDLLKFDWSKLVGDNK